MRRRSIRALAGRGFRPCTTRLPSRSPDRAQPPEVGLLGHAAEYGLVGRHRLPVDRRELAVLGPRPDLATRKIVGWSLRDHIRAELTVPALSMAT